MGTSHVPKDPEQPHHAFVKSTLFSKRIRSMIGYISYTVIVGFALAEIGTRLLTSTSDNGMPQVILVLTKKAIPLLPYRPESAMVEAWIKRRY